MTHDENIACERNMEAAGSLWDTARHYIHEEINQHPEILRSVALHVTFLSVIATRVSVYRHIGMLAYTASETITFSPSKRDTFTYEHVKQIPGRM
jgi:hypothetical protein